MSTPVGFARNARKSADARLTVRSHEKHSRFDHNLFKKRRRSAVGRIIHTEALR